MPKITVLPHHEICPEGTEVELEAGKNLCKALLEKGIKMSIDTHTHRILTLEKAKLILSQGDEEQTKALAKGVLSEKNVTPVQKQVAEELLGKISG